MSRYALPILALMLAIVAVPALAGDLSVDLPGTDIMTLVHDRPDGDDRSSVIIMTLLNKRGSKRVREVKSYSKDFGKDKQSIMVFLEPADVRKTAYLSWEYDEPGREDDKWLYMPAMRKTRRISGASRNEYFMGTDFTYDDMGKRRVDEDTHRLLGEESVDGLDCWKVECVPVDSEDMYTRRVVWVRKDACVVIKAEYYDKDGLLKIFRVLDVRNQDGIWTVFRSEMENVVREHRTVMETTTIAYDTGLEDSLFRVATI